MVQSSEEANFAEMDTLEEARQQAQVQNAAAQQRAARRYNTRVKPRKLKRGDLVLRLCQGPRKDREYGKLEATWEGPFRVREDVGNRAYRLETLDQNEIPWTWNSSHLKFYHY